MNKVIRTLLMPKRICLNLFGFFLVRDPSWVDRFVINHERIHDAQQRELLWIPFYILYLLEWAWRLMLCGNLDRAYRAISFEREAYAHGDDLGYLKHRRHYAQWRRL